MKKVSTFVFFIFIILLITLLRTESNAQDARAKWLGKWITEDNSLMEVYANGAKLEVKQIKAGVEQDRKHDGKIVCKDLVATDKGLSGIMIDHDSGKEYKGILTMDKDGKSLTLAVKWGFLSFKDVWKRQ
jgi:uncharacterized protein (DUF2147 family)